MNENYNHLHGDAIEYALEDTDTVLVHGCNCFHAMGAGIAKQIADRFPEALEADKQHSEYGDKSKLGSFTFARTDSGLIIVNAYTQFDFRREGNQMPVDYTAVRSVFKKLALSFHGMEFIYPAIGAGLAGGDWGVIRNIIKQELVNERHCYVEYSQ